MNKQTIDSDSVVFLRHCTLDKFTYLRTYKQSPKTILVVRKTT